MQDEEAGRIFIPGLRPFEFDSPDAWRCSYFSLFTMTELATREFISQWAYDHGQDRGDVREEAAVQCIGVDRVAELMRQRHEHHQDGNFNAMDFDTRAAAIDAHFLRAPRCESPGSDRKPQTPVRPTRVRPQSASLARRAADSSIAQRNISVRQRPQSAKYRSDMARCDESVGQVDWNASAQEKTSKWREMLARGPEFQQLTLRKLELETYELLYKTLDQRQEINAKPTRRRRKRENAESICKPNSSSPAPACGSGLHLARSRKKRQQEHDRQMMLGKDRQNSRRSDKEKAKGEDKQMIQEKTRRRNKLLSKKKSQRGCRRDDQVAKQEKQPEEPPLQRPSSAKRGPWIPSGSSSSLAIRGISSEASGLPVTQEERIAQVLEVFQSHAKAHFRFSKHVQKQLKKAQQCAKTAIANESRKTKQAVKHFSESEFPAKHGRPASASRVNEHTSNYVSRDNQEDDQVEVVRGAIPSALLSKSKSPANEDESLPGGSPATLRLVIPPLKLPPNLWEYQLTGSTLDEDSQLCHEESNIALEDINTIAPSVVSKYEASFSQPKPEKPQAMRDKPAPPAQALRRPTVEDVYLAESDVEQGSDRSSSNGSKSPPVPRDQEMQPLLTHEEGAPADIDVCTPTFLPGNTLTIGVDNAQSSSNSSELLLVDTSLGSAYTCREGSQSAAWLTAFEQKAFIDTTTNKPVSYQGSTQDCTSVNNASTDARGYGRNVNVENTTSECTNSGIDLAEKHNAAIFDCAMDNISRSITTGNMELTGDSASGECKGSGNISDESDMLVHDADVNSPMSLIAAINDANSSNFSSDLPRSVDHRFNKALSEKQYDPIMIKKAGVPPSSDSGLGSLDQLSSRSCTLLTSDSDSVSIQRTSEIVQTTILETSDILDRCDRGSDGFQSEGNQWRVSLNDCGECQEAEDDTTILSSPSSRECPTMETPNVVVAARSGTISSPPNEVDEILPALEVKDDRFAVEGSRSANKASRSPKRRAKKPKGPLSVKSVSLKKSRAVVNREQCSSSQPAAVDASAFAVLKSRTPSPEDDGRRGEEEEDPLRLHHQEVARSFLKRISSRKVVDLETGSIQSQPSKEQVGGDNEVGAAESVAAKTVLTATNIEDQVELNVIPVKDEYNGGTLDPVRPSDSESTVEKHPLAEVSVRSPATTADVATTPSTERVDMTPVFTSSVDEDFTSSSATVASYAEALQSSVVEASNLGKERRMPISEDAQPELEISTIVADTNQAQSPRTFAPEHYQRAARKIQAQYRCFARRRIILDQLRFIMAKQRREARRQSRVKTKRTKEVVVDTFASVPTGEYESHITDVNRFGGGLSEDIHQVAVEMSSAAPLIQLGEDVKFAAQKDSGDYVLDLFDGSNQANGEVTQEVYTGNIAETADEVSVILPHNAIGESATSSENLVDQQDLYAASEKDVDTVNIANATISREPLQREEGVFDERPLRPNSLGLGVETQQPAGVGLISSTLLAELAFDDVEGEQPAVHEDPLRGLQPHWERYMDSATNKSFYFNPATNETQWTNPEDHSVINSIGTPTTSHVTVTAKVNSASKTAQVWQEFLDETSGQLYYYNTQTGECSWEAPAANSDAAEVVASPQSGATAETAASPWIMYIDPASQAPYYVNVETLVTTWEQPDEFALAAPESTAVVTADADSVIEDAYVIAVDD